METFTLLLGLFVIFLVAAAAYLVGQRTVPSASTVNTSTDTGAEQAAFAVEIARLQEREKTLIADIARQASELQRFADALAISQKDHAASREKLAASDERTAGLQQTLSTERQNNDTARNALLADLSASMEARDRLQISFTEESQKLAAADERATGLQQALSHERENNDASRRTLLADLTTATEARDRLQISFTEESQKLAAAAQMEQELRDRVSRAENYIAERDKKIGDLEKQMDEYRTQLSTRDRDLSASSERELALNRTVAERDQQLQGLQETLRSEFENIANKVLATTANQLSEQSQVSLTAILNPLRDRIAEFQNKVETTHLADTAQRSALGEQIRQVALANQTIGLEAHNLTKALKGDSQMRGRWGEVRLERILEKSGLERGREFVIQGGDFNIKSEEGGSERPDVIILLPENRHFVIDSKISLVDYLEYEAAETDDLRARSLKKLLSSVRAHIDDLAGKNYQYADAINSHDLVFMFMPIEGVAALVLQNDESVFDYAWGRKIVMASPSTLFMTMQTVGSIWRYERQSENAQAIAEQAGQLYDKLVGVVGDLNDVSQKIQAAADAHTDAMKKLSTGKGNALSRAQKLKLLGVTSKKDLPMILLNSEKHIVDADDDDDAELVLLESHTP